MLTFKRPTVVVNLVDGRTAIVGTRRWSWPWHVVLTGARVHRGDRPADPLDGRVVVPRHRIDFLQVVA